MRSIDLFLRETEINLSRTSSQIDIKIELASSILSDFRVNSVGTSCNILGHSLL
jgi:hypothetical protein